MPRFQGEPDFRHGQPHRIGVLLCNVGTPAAPTTKAVRRYLMEFLSDPRVVEMPRWLWLPILHGVILNLRPRRSARAYRSIWRDAGSPLLVIAQQQAQAMTARLASHFGDTVMCTLAMRYGEPSIGRACEQMRAANVRRLLVLPLYPQYAAATTASVFDAVFVYCQHLRWVPELRVIADYHADPGYIAALTASIAQYWDAHGRSERLLMSYHGVPRETFLAGDPYHCQCHATSRLLAQALALEDGTWSTSFQSRFGPKRWLEPYTETTLAACAREGLRTIDVVCPGFSADCLETLEEIEQRYAQAFTAAGGASLRYIPALNERDDHIAALSDIVVRHLGSWLEDLAITDPRVAADARHASTSRAREMGAER